jgi:hypothetical protein
VLLELTINSPVHDVGDEARLQARSDLVIEALAVVFGSNENFRHLDHCSEDSCGSEVMKVLLN